MAFDDVHIFEDARDGISISSDGTSVKRPTVEESIRACRDLGVNDPLVLGPDEHLRFDTSAATRYALLEALSPGEELAERLDELFDSDMTGDPRATPVSNAGNEVDVEPWAWMHGLDAWHLVPGDEGDQIAFISAVMTENMGGMIIQAGIRRWDDIAVAWHADDVDGMQWRPVTYGVQDWDALLVEAARQIFEEPECPCCESGWPITVDVDALFTEAAIGEVLNLIWHPCEEHTSSCALTGIAGHDRDWIDNGWVPKHDNQQSE